MTQPRARIDGATYVATWAPILELIWREIIDGKEVTHNPPREVESQGLFVVKDSGAIYGPGAPFRIEDLPFTVHLPESPAPDQLLRYPAIERYAEGQRPDPVAVFERLVAVYDRFIDFDRSLASQREMCELSACLSLMTWFAPAFTVLPYPYPNGERGSGKSQWGVCWAKTSYLGEIILAGSSYATLRDLADYGATLLFDDAENLSDPKRSDPDKRTLLLAGNRQGATVALKEKDPRTDQWRTRRVNAFCPRGFTAISLPDQTLASRVIVIPLVRTIDVSRGNHDPANPRHWPHDRHDLQDDLWSLTLWLLAEAEQITDELLDDPMLMGRSGEIWRAIIATARLMDRHGAVGLETRMRDVMTAYQSQRSEIVGLDDESAVIQAVFEIVSRKGAADDQAVTFSTSEVIEILSEPDAGDSMTSDQATPQRVGRILKRLRFEQRRTSEARLWITNLKCLRGIAASHGLAL